MTRAPSAPKDGDQGEAMTVAEAMTVRATESLVERVAQRTAEIVLDALRVEGAAPADGRTLVDAATVAQALGVDRSWVYDHAGDLGAVRLGEVGGGRRPRLRFDLDAARERAASCWASRESEAAQDRSASGGRPGRPRRPLGTDRDLLPIRGADRASAGGAA